MVNHDILHWYRVGYRYLGCRGISGDIPREPKMEQGTGTQGTEHRMIGKCHFMVVKDTPTEGRNLKNRSGRSTTVVSIIWKTMTRYWHCSGTRGKMTRTWPLCDLSWNIVCPWAQDESNGSHRTQLEDNVWHGHTFADQEVIGKISEFLMTSSGSLNCCEIVSCMCKNCKWWKCNILSSWPCMNVFFGRTDETTKIETPRSWETEWLNYYLLLRGKSRGKEKTYIWVSVERQFVSSSFVFKPWPTDVDTMELLFFLMELCLLWIDKSRAK